MTAEACNCDAADKLGEYKQRLHFLNEDLLNANNTITELRYTIMALRAECQRLERGSIDL